MSRLVDYLPKGLKLGELGEHRGTIPILSDQSQIGSISFDGVFSAELFATADLFSLYCARPAHRDRMESVPSSYLRKLPRRAVESWWQSVLNEPVSVGLNHEFRIQKDHLIGFGMLYRGLLLCFSCFAVERSPARPSWRHIRDTRRNLRSTLMDEPTGITRSEGQESKSKKKRTFKLCASGGYSPQYLSGILEVDGGWNRFICHRGMEAELLEEAFFPKEFYKSSYTYFLESVGRFLPYFQYLTKPLPLQSLHFDDLISEFRKHFPHQEHNQ